MYKCIFVFLLLLACLNKSGAIAQEAKSAAGSDRASLARATRIMRKIDKDGNGSFEKAESPAAWRRYRNLDANGDGLISIEELRKQRDASLETDGKKRLDVVYKSVGNRDLRLDLYYPTNETKGDPSRYPLIVYTHGGGWAAGSKQGIAKGLFEPVFQKLLGRGFAVASVEYRLCRPGSGVTMRDCVIDCKDAVRYLANSSQSLHLEPSQFFVMGDSAGGQIAQMLLLSAPETLPGDKALAKVSYHMLAGVSWYGPSDFEKIDLFNYDDRDDFRDRFAARILGPEPDASTKLDRYREMSPVNYLNQDSPPLLMMQGDKDTTSPVKHAHYMKQKAEAMKAPVEVMIVKNAGHNWRKVDAEIDPSRDAIVEGTVKFFVDQLASQRQ